MSALHPFLVSYWHCGYPSRLTQQQQQQQQQAGRRVQGCAPHTVPALLLLSGRLCEQGWLHNHPPHLALLHLLPLQPPPPLLLLCCCFHRVMLPQQPL
jgi:hypothetical protein